MHIIAASKLINATQYAAGLGLAPDNWRGITSESDGLVGDRFHILPGTDALVADAVIRNSLKNRGAKLIDHR